METIDSLTIFNVAMICCIVVVMLANRALGKSNRELHERNKREREREKKRFPELYVSDDV